MPRPDAHSQSPSHGDIICAVTGSARKATKKGINSDRRSLSAPSSPGSAAGSRNQRTMSMTFQDIRIKLNNRQMIGSIVGEAHSVQVASQGRRVFNRQKAILYILKAAGRPVSHIELVKWCFVVAHETPSGGGPSFYEFLPYQKGPFSFCLYRETDILMRYGLLRDVGASRWEATADAGSVTGSLGRSIRNDLLAVVNQFRDVSVERLLDYVYEKYPWFTMNSNIKKLQPRPIADPAIYTAGYQGQHVDGFLNGLLRSGIKRVVDVRHNPVSRQYGFHKSTLSRLCGQVELEYEHWPHLGIPSGLRRGGQFATRGDLFRHYLEAILPSRGTEIAELAEAMKNTPTALVCMESAPADCHRSRLANVLAEASGLPVCHLRRGACTTRINSPTS
jgi:hypothetical protein